VYKNNPHITEELQQEISAAVISGSEETPAADARDFRRRLQMVLGAMMDILKMGLRHCLFAKSTELGDTKLDLCLQCS
jgi:hypothetical protein